MRKKVFIVLLMLLLTVSMTLKNSVVIEASESQEPIVDFSISGRLISVKISAYEMIKGVYVISYNPEVLEIEAKRSSEEFSESVTELGLGKIEISFKNFFVDDYDEYLGTIIFRVIGCGSGDLNVESVSITNSEDTYVFHPTVTGERTNFIVHDVEYDNVTSTLKLKHAEDDVFRGNEASVLDECRETAKSLVFEEGLKELTCDCFSDFSVLEEVVIPTTFTNISEGAFQRVQDSNEVLCIEGKSMSFAEEYATVNDLSFVPTNEQLQGDVDGNGEYEAVDALGILKMVVELETTYGYSADTNADGEVSAEDALKVLRKVVELE